MWQKIKILQISFCLRCPLLSTHLTRKKHFSVAAPKSPLKETNQERQSKKLTPMSLCMLVIPLATFGLGTWQVKRKKWKEQLIVKLASRTGSEPCDLPLDLLELNTMEYYPVRVSGHFDHSREIYMGPRSLLIDGDAATDSRLISQGTSGQSGYLVITPFQLADRDVTILVNRGWVPNKARNPKLRSDGQIEGETEVVGIVRLDERRAQFMPENKLGAWFYRDLKKMCEVTGADPVFLEATVSSSVPGGPIGGQTRISLRNEHVSYIVTWFGLSAVTSFMWYRRFIRGFSLM